MKNRKKIVLLILLFSICLGALSCKSYSTVASEYVRIKSYSNLSQIEYDNKDILIGLDENQTVNDLLSNLYTYDTVTVSKNNVTLSSGDIVPTGALLSCGTEQYYIVIKGDTTGDGVVDASDFLQIKKFFLESFDIGGIYFLAGDTTEDGIIDATDYLQVRQYFLGNFDLYPDKNTGNNSNSIIDIIKDGQCEYKICYAGESEKIAAYTLRELLSLRSGIVLPIEMTTNVAGGTKIIYLSSSNLNEVGNYGYTMKSDDALVSITASSLCGFDNAFEHLLIKGAESMSVSCPSDYNVVEKLDWESNYVLEGTDYNSEYNDGLFYNDKNDSVAYVSNAMWHMFGAVDDGQQAVAALGNEPTWFEWNSEKIAWSGNTQYINEVKKKIRYFPQTSTGYMWSWSSYPFWKVDDCYSIHYDGTFRYISAVYDIICWEGNTDFLYQKDTNTATGEYSSLDASRGKTVLKKTQACMDYILEYLYGKYGYIKLTEESTYLNSNGTKRFDYVKEAGINCWNNTGKDGSGASNYWDNLCFGNYDGYSHALYYNALTSMAGIYRMIGGDCIDDAEQLEVLAAKVKEDFNDLYWSEEKGRYVACIDADGRVVDYGLTFHNYEAMKYGLADAEQAKLIFDWVDGDRIINGENRVGGDIFSYAKLHELVNASTSREIASLDLRLASVTNTIAINNPENQKLGVAWWHAPAGIDVWGSASYGKHLENGGYIFYPVFYELMARTEYEGAQSTTDRLYDIGRVYEYNRLMSDAAAIGSTHWLEGLKGEFPESGLVPTTYFYSLIGVSAEYDGLHLSPAFNDVYEYMGVKTFKYGGNAYGIKVNRDSSFEITPSSGTVSMKLHYTPERFKSVSYTLTITKTDGTVSNKVVSPDANGVIYLNISQSRVSSVKLTPNL